MRAGPPFAAGGLLHNRLGYPSAQGSQAVDAAEQTHEAPRYRAIFISDLHIGTPGFQADALLDFLKHHPCQVLYLVGDIVDGWQLRRRWFWPQSHNDVVQKLLRRARKGCRVIYVPGNHDEFARAFVGHAFGGVEVQEEAVHVTATGQRLWVVHGDLFDGVIQCAKWLAHVGDWLYEFTLKLNRHLNRLRARLGLEYWSLSAYLKHKVKKAVNFISDFEVAVAHEARRRGFDGGSAAIFTMPKSEGWMVCCTATTVTGWKAAPHWWSTWTVAWKSCTGLAPP